MFLNNLVIYLLSKLVSRIKAILQLHIKNSSQKSRPLGHPVRGSRDLWSSPWET
jgi:hypothetical protein